MQRKCFRSSWRILKSEDLEMRTFLRDSTLIFGEIPQVVHANL